MKMNTSLPQDKLQILEDGSWDSGKDNTVSILKRIEKPSVCSRFLEIAKLIVYLELILIIGWIGCIFLSQNIGNKGYKDFNTEISHPCDYSMDDCTLSDIENEINHELIMKGIRDKRSGDEDELKVQSCISNMNATRDKINQLTEQLIPGDDSDSNTSMLRENCKTQIVGLTLRVMMDKLVSKTYPSEPTDEQWSAFALDIKPRIINSTGEEHREKVESSGPPTPEMVNDLRDAVESMILNYKNCEKVIPDEDGASTEPSIGDLLNLRDKCERINDSLIEDARPLIAQIIPGDSSDPVIVQLRERVENITLMMTYALVVDSNPTWDLDTVSDRVGNLTDERWRKFIDSVRDDVVNSSSSAQREMIETPITQEMINDIRTGVYSHINKVRHCNELTNIINNVRVAVDTYFARTKRDSDWTLTHGLLRDSREKSELKIAKLLALKNVDSAWSETL